MIKLKTLIHSSAVRSKYSVSCLDNVFSVSVPDSHAGFQLHQPFNFSLQPLCFTARHSCIRAENKRTVFGIRCFTLTVFNWCNEGCCSGRHFVVHQNRTNFLFSSHEGLEGVAGNSHYRLTPVWTWDNKTCIMAANANNVSTAAWQTSLMCLRLRP